MPQPIPRAHRPPRSRPRAHDGPTAEVEVDGRTLRLTHLDKVLWPDVGFTKSQLIDYYARMAPVLLPHVVERPMTLARFPDGVDVDGWYQTDCWQRPEWMRSAHVVLPHGKREGRDYCVFDDVAAIVWAANQAAIELHPLLATLPDLETPHAVVFDLDPGEPAGLVECAEVACALRDVLAASSLDAYAKVSGAKGMQVYVPLNRPHGYDTTKTFAHAVARLLAQQRPDAVTAEMPTRARRGKVFVDWGQNDPNKSTIAPYSLRSTPTPTVSAPFTWDEIEAAVERRDARRLLVGAEDVFERIDRHGDLFEPVLQTRQSLPR